MFSLSKIIIISVLTVIGGILIINMKTTIRVYYILLSPLIRGIVKLKIGANWLTMFGLVLGILSGFLFAYNYLLYAGIVLLVSGICDTIDGSVARMSGKKSPFGKVLDSVVDRYSELPNYIGLSFFYATQGMWLYFLLGQMCIVGAVIVSYTRARAESIGIDCRVGIAERHARITALIVGSIAGWLFSAGWYMQVVLWLIAVFSNITALQRIYFVWRTLKLRNSYA